MADVRLVDLEVLKRFSLVLRREHAEAGEVLAALEASRLQVLRNLGERVSRDRGEAELVDGASSHPPEGAVQPDRRRERPLRAPSRPGPSPGPAPAPGSPRT